MQSLFFEYKKLNSNELDRLWKDCIFVFDTNVLLNFYRYSESTFNELKDALFYYKDRIWVPNQVGIEFFRNRLDVINEQKKNYDEQGKNLKKLKNTFLTKKGHPFISQIVLEEFNTVLNKIDKEFHNQENSLSELINKSKDHIVDMVFELFNNKTGKPYTLDQLNKLYNEGKERYKDNIPPGYKDIKKPEPKRYGDFIIWKQIMEKSLVEKKSIIFICDDEKEDWFETNSNQILGPAPELIKEFKETTQQDFYIYQTFMFLKHTYDVRNKKIDQPAIDEIIHIASSNIDDKGFDLYKYHSIDFVIKRGTQSKEELDRFYLIIQNQGYNLNIKEISDHIQQVSLNVPFEDLVRRFHKTLVPLISEYGLDLLSFNSSKTTTSF